jgi:hypothetical protein
MGVTYGINDERNIELGFVLTVTVEEEKRDRGKNHANGQLNRRYVVALIVSHHIVVSLHKRTMFSFGLNKN